MKKCFANTLWFLLREFGGSFQVQWYLISRPFTWTFLTMGISKTPPRVFNIWWHKSFQMQHHIEFLKDPKFENSALGSLQTDQSLQFRSFFRGRIICPYSVFGNFWGGDTTILKDVASATIITDKIKGTKPHVPTTPFS